METNPYAPPKVAVLEAASGDNGELIVEGRKLPAGRGMAWFGEAWQLFKAAPGIWILVFIIFMAMTLVLAIIPGGSIISYLFYPVFTGGLMLGCRDIEAGNPLEASHLFAGFKHNTANLVLVGLLYMVGLVVVTIVAFVPIGILAAFVVPGLAGAGDSADFTAAMLTLIPLFLLGFLLIVALSLPLMMALWFAPALVVFHDLQPTAAMKASFSGCMKNLMPFLVYGLVGLGLLILALIPLGLGLLVFSPVLWATMYTGYRDIYIRPN